MTWSLRIAARTPLGAAAEIDKDRYVPDGFKAAIRDAVKRLRPDHGDIVVVRTQGHLDERGGRAEIDIALVRLFEGSERGSTDESAG